MSLAPPPIAPSIYRSFVRFFLCFDLSSCSPFPPPSLSSIPVPTVSHHLLEEEKHTAGLGALAEFVTPGSDRSFDGRTFKTDPLLPPSSDRRLPTDADSAQCSDLLKKGSTRFVEGTHHLLEFVK